MKSHIVIWLLLVLFLFTVFVLTYAFWGYIDAEAQKELKRDSNTTSYL